MVSTILMVLAAALLMFLAYVALQPGEFRIVRTAVLSARPDQVFRQVNDFHNWQQWSPWARLDPDAKAEFSGAESGEGATFRWSGNKDVGVGSMTIIDSRPHERIRMRLDFEAPMRATNIAEFTFKPVDRGTEMTWAMSGSNGFVGRLMCMFMNVDKMVGGQFEQGLANLEAIVSGQKA